MLTLGLFIGVTVGFLAGYLIGAAFAKAADQNHFVTVYHLRCVVAGFLKVTGKYHDDSPEMTKIRRYAQDALEKGV